MPALLLRFLFVAALAYIAGSTITPMVYAQAVQTQAEQTLSPFLLFSCGILLFGVGYAVKQLFHPMKTLLFPCLGAFVAGVFVGAGLWFALIVCAAVLAAWHGWLNPSPPDRSSLKHITQFGPRRRGGGH